MRYEFWIDRGGTFTDCILFDRHTGALETTKVLSSDEAPLLGMRELLRLDDSAPIPPSEIRMGTTVATNALLERAGARCALVITRGFRDLLEIGDQTRSDLFALDIEKPETLYHSVHEWSARLSPKGATVEEPSDKEIRQLAVRLADEKNESVALVALHAYRMPEFETHLEKRLEAAWPRDAPLPEWICSAGACEEQGLLKRAGTAVLDAYVTPRLRTYLQSLKKSLPGSRLLLMQSSGGLASIERFRGPAALLSGPAGGLVAGEHIARLTKSQRLVTFDMGGTSTDVALIRGKTEKRYEKMIDGVPISAPMLDLNTVAAGGGSVCRFDGYGLTVGPESVGADPGPVCYGRYRDAAPDVAITDVNLVLGRIAEDHFSFPLQTEKSWAALATIAQRVSEKTGETTSVEDIALGFSAVCTTNMAEAIRSVTTRKGIAPETTDLLVLGGAGGQHACALATALGIKRVLVHRLSGVLSAYGMGLSDVLTTSEFDAENGRLSQQTVQRLTALFEHHEETALQRLSKELPEVRHVPQISRILAIRYLGTESTIDVPFSDEESIRNTFEREHRRQFGYARTNTPLEVVVGRVEARLSPGEAKPIGSSGDRRQSLPPPKRFSEVVLQQGNRDSIPVYELDTLDGCPPLRGPALLLDPTGTHLLEQGFEALLTREILEIRVSESSKQVPASSLNDEARIQIFATRFSSIAEQMGEALRRSASSTNIRDRLDFSCAIFDSAGQLIANAPHIPVHLGAMSESVAAVLTKHPQLRPGDAFITNDPALGGSHLPDITVVTPVFDKAQHLICFTASRGHHADVGGITPGSMPAFSRTLAEEGVVFSAEPLVSGGKMLEAELREKLSHGPNPARNPEENIADLSAQLAANQLGMRLALQLHAEIGATEFAHGMQSVLRLSSLWMREAISALEEGTKKYRDQLDDGTVVQVELRVSGSEMTIDFSGSGAESLGNLNAPRAVTLACVLYVMRTLLNRPLPLNAGCLAPVTVKLPERSILNPGPDRAVAAGNVETSMRIVDVLLGALGLAAASQGTMNNLSFGNDEFGYYETIAGGAGAGPSFDGASGVHTHMTNTRITDPEVLEGRFPVRVEEFGLRRGSGGLGRHSGGDGIVRQLQFLAPVDLSIVSQRRALSPFGLQGGLPGSKGRNLIDGLEAQPSLSTSVPSGASVRIETPGGGGYGPAEPELV